MPFLCKKPLNALFFRISVLRIAVLVCWFSLNAGFSAHAQNIREFQKLYNEIGSLLPDSTRKAEELAQKMLSLAIQNQEEDSLITKSYYLLGIVYYYQSKYRLAEKYYQRAMNTRYGKVNTQIQEGCLNNLGVVYDSQNNIKEALKAYFGSLRIAESRNDSLSIVQSWINIALLEKKSGNFSNGIELARKGLEYSKRHRDTLNILLCHQNLGILYGLRSDFIQSKYHNDQSLRWAVILGSQYHIARVRINLAYYEFRTGNIPKAVAHLNEAQKAASINPLESFLPSILVAKGQYLKSAGNLQEAESVLKEALNLSTKTSRQELVEPIYQELTDLYAKKGNIPAYEKAFGKFLGLQEERTQKSAIAAAYEELRAMYEIDKLEQEKVILDKRRSLFQTRFWAATIIAISLLGLLVSSFLYYRQKERINTLELNKSTLEKELREQELDMERKINLTKEQVITQQKQQLAITAIQQINLKEHIQAMVSDLKEDKDADITYKLAQIENNQQWNDFLDKFNLINPTFITSLSKAYPDLNHSELIFCALVKLNLSFKEIANLLHIAHRSVYIKKYRIAKKMALQEDDFYKIILSID